MPVVQMLVGCTSFETAHCTSAYPYGRTLRCQRREWLEYKAGHGYRFVTCTNNPKRPGLVWNKPHASTYAALAVMYLDENEHVQWACLHTYTEEGTIDAFVATYGEGLQGAQEQAILHDLRNIARISKARWEAYLAKQQQQTQVAD
jgi:hypothetical protein